MGWGDHYSSDEEDLQEDVPAYSQAPPTPQDEKGDEHAAKQETPKPREFVWPTEPPYTAYVGNLSYEVADENDMRDFITQLSKDLLNKDVQVTHTRLMRHRKGADPPSNAPHRGFGYVHFDTLEELKAVVEGLNGKEFKGRRLQLDAAQSPVKPKGNNRKNRRGGDGPPAQRPSLNLQPRTKPANDDGLSNSNSDIFGSGRARDETSWRERRKSENEERRGSRGDDNKRGPRGGGGRNSGRGGRGRGGGREGRRDSIKKVTASPVTPSKPPEKKVVKPDTSALNKFAALGFDSDSD